MTRMGSKPVSIVLTAFLILALTACSAKGEAQPSASSPGTETPAGSETGVIFEPSQPASPPDSTESQEPSPTPSASSSASVSPSPSKEPAATSEPPAAEDHGHDSPKPSQDDDGKKDDGGKKEDDDKPSPSPKPSDSPSPSASPSASTSPSSSPEPSPSPSKEPEAQTFVVEIKGFAFSPAEVTVKPGDKVKFINRDKVEHTATADNGSFNTDLLGLDDSKTITMKTEGTFGYFCAPHPDMRGQIVVKAK